MKYLLVLLTLSSVANAKEFLFTYNMPNGKKVQSLKYKTDADTWEEAFSRGADFCYNFFVDKKPLTEDRILQITDVCANPSTK